MNHAMIMSIFACPTARANGRRRAPETPAVHCIICLILGLLLPILGCKRSADPDAVAVEVKPQQAAGQLQQAFNDSDADVRKAADAASEALNTADYETAVQSLQLLRERGSLTVDQGMAVHNSMVSLESRLISAMASGDENAKRAYDQLRKARRN